MLNIKLLNVQLTQTLVFNMIRVERKKNFEESPEKRRAYFNMMKITHKIAYVMDKKQLKIRYNQY